MRDTAKPQKVNIHVGKQLQTMRVLRGMSRISFAERLGVAYQQIQKYETGANRITAGMLWRASKILGTPVSYFFDGLDGNAEPEPRFLRTRGALELVQSFQDCSEEIQQQLLILLQTVQRDACR